MPYSQIKAHHIQDIFDPETYQLGKALQQSQQVSELEASSQISARVKDPAQGICQTFISIQNNDATLAIEGECSCEREENCAHVVATLLQLIESLANKSDIQLSYTPRKSLYEQNSFNWESNRESSKENNREIHYILSLSKNQGTDRLKLTLQLASHRPPEKTSLPHTQLYSIPHPLNNPPRFIQPADLEIFQLLQSQGQLTGISYFLPVNNRILLDQLLATERCHWQSIEQPVLTQQAPLAGHWVWIRHTDGSQQLSISPGKRTAQVLPCLPLRYFSEQEQKIGLIHSGLSDMDNSQLFKLPAYAVDKISHALRQPPLCDFLNAQIIPMPEQATQIEKRQARVNAVLSLTLIPSGKKPHSTFWAARTKLEAKLEFAYPGRRISHSEDSPYIGQFEGGVFIQWQRDRAAETTAIETLQQLGWWPDLSGNGDTWHCPEDDNGLSFARAIAFDLPALQQQGWQIQSPANTPSSKHNKPLPQIIKPHTDTWLADLTPFENQYMLLGLTTEHNSQSINLIQALHTSLHHRWIQFEASSDEPQQSLLATDSQQIICIDNHHLKPLLNQLLELAGRRALHTTNNNETGLLLSRARLQAIQTLCHSLDIKLTLAENLATKQDIPAPQNAKLNAQLRDYQQQGVNWLSSLFQHRLGGLLADDMGLGKTLQILAFIWQCKQQNLLDKPILILAPTSLLGNWKAEAEKFTPGLKLQLLHGAKRHRHFSRIAQCDLVITSYPLVVRDLEPLLTQPWQMLILDEAQAIKNPQSQTSRAVHEFNADCNFCLSGTPLENHLGELWSLFDFTLPGLLGSKQQFNDWFREPIENNDDQLQYELLIERVRAFMLRRLKRDVLPQLPEKTHQLCLIEMGEEQQYIYDSIQLHMKKNLRQQIHSRGVQGSRMHILDALTRLRQICCDPRLLSDSTAISESASAKLTHLMGMLEEMLPQGRKILLFSQFTSMLKLIQQALDDRGIKYALITGQTRQRDQQVKRFQAGEVPLFLISLKAGGSGLNLTRADTVIHYDPWWNPAAENQATDRAHRIGQHKSVMVYKLIIENTIEQKILELQQRKQALADILLDNSSSTPEAFDSSDLDSLLELLDYSDSSAELTTTQI